MTEKQKTLVVLKKKKVLFKKTKKFKNNLLKIENCFILNKL